jgi:predicted MFS family arabinose efflux permease
MAARKVLPVIIISQFLCTTLWFGGNAVLADMSNELQLHSSALGAVTASVQLGFITGTFIYALLTIADRYNPSLVFFLSAIAASLSNVCIIETKELDTLLVLRFSTGFFLAGIYPVGMKVAADYFEKGLGKALGFLVGALVLGTAFPHLLKSLSIALSWKTVIFSISIMALIGGLMMWLLVPPGPYRRPMQKLDAGIAVKVFKPRAFRSAAFGYFGHMWELYTFWAFLPLLITTWSQRNKATINISLLAFIVIAAGAIACVAAGFISQKLGTKRIAVIALFSSACCCILSPFSFLFSETIFIIFLVFWGWMVVADSPMFSTLVAANADVHHKGTALTIVTCIGFFITVISIQLLNKLSTVINPEQLYLILAVGPFLGLIALIKRRSKQDQL